MPYQLFSVPIQGGGDSMEELNRFLGSHRVLEVDRRWVDLGASSFWSFCVDYLEDGMSSPQSRSYSNRNKIDYKDVLKPEEFALFSRLRDVRKQLAASEAVPVYTIVTNEQLAQMVQLPCTTAKDLDRVVGFGESRIAKYGSAFLAILQSAGGRADEAGGKPV